MKKTFLFIIVAALVCACGNNGTVNYKIKGDLQNLLSGKIYLTDINGNPIDSADVKEGKFLIKGQAAQETGAFLLQYPSFLTQVLLENGTITVNGDTENPIISGTPANEGYQKMINDMKSLENADEEAVDSLQLAIIKQTFKDNANNILGLFLMQNAMLFWDTDEIADAYNLLPEKYKNREEASVAKQMTITAIGNKYINIELQTANGETEKLSSLVDAGNYVLLDFWASWCGPCMGEIPYLTAAYEKYKDKGFEIYGVSLDREAKDWVKAYIDNNMNWIQVSELNYWDTKPAKDYGVISIPANFLISPDGTIIAHNLRGEELENKLAEIFE